MIYPLDRKSAPDPVPRSFQRSPHEERAYASTASCEDGLDARYHGTTDAYTLLNGSVGYKWPGSRLTTSLKMINIANQDIQQHVFGDVLKRQIIGELRVQF